MKWKPYPEYKDSGVEWLEEIPAHWEVARVKDICRLNPDVLGEDTPKNLEIKYVDIANVTPKGDVLEVQEFPFSEAPSRARRKVGNGDTILSTVRTYLRAVAYIENPPDNLIVSTGFAALRPNRGVHARYLFWMALAKQFIDRVVAYSEGVAYPAINPSQLACLPVWIPQLPEQEAIASFLDRETATIDAMIAKKERLIALLEEKRKALISHAVTKGLNPDAPMKDSGIEWLGQIPAHWRRIRIKYLVGKIEQGWSPQCENRLADEDEWAVLKVGCVNGIAFDEKEHKALPIECVPLPEFVIKPGDILISRANTRELLGSASLVENVRPKLMLCDKLYRVRPTSNELLPQYLVYLLRSRLCRHQMEVEATGASSSMQNIGQDTVRNLWAVFPPLESKQESLNTFNS